jgi:hypothetical protein
MSWLLFICLLFLFGGFYFYIPGHVAEGFGDSECGFLVRNHEYRR